MVLARLLLIGFARNLRNIRATLPAAEVFLCHGQRTIALHVANQNNRRVLRPVITIVELQAVFILVRHVLDVFDETHRSMRISVTLISGRAQHFKEFLFGIRAVLIEFPKDGFRFGFIAVKWILQMLETIGFEFKDPIEIVFGKDFVIDGAIVGRISIRIGAGLLQNLVAFLAGIVLAAAKH